MVMRRRTVGRKPKVQSAARASRVASSDANAQQAEVRHAETDWDRDVHMSRDQEYPSDEPIHEDEVDWKPAALLEAPPPRPGYVQRWIRVERGSQQDFRNLRAKHQEGWQPRDPNSVPGGWTAPTETHGTLGSCIMVGGMVLCEMPVRRNQQRAAYFQRRLDQQTEAVDRQLMQVQQPGHPIDRQAKTRVTVGKRPAVQDDDEAA